MTVILAFFRIGVMVALMVAALQNVARCVDMELVDKHNKELGACQACRTFVKSFLKAMDATSRGKHEGGDADWESKKLKDYARSEVRLAEIYSSVCLDVKIGKNQCHRLSGELEELIETEWWPQWPRADLQHWLCVQQHGVCCQAGHYGTQCLPCPGLLNSGAVCSGRGRCKGAGSRKGSGQCVCDQGYAGAICDQCNATRHYQQTAAGHHVTDDVTPLVTDDVTPLVCLPCHRSCQSSCSGPGAKLCTACGDGFLWSAETGCSDIDECRRTDGAICRRSQFCVNNIGSFSCLDCDRACSSCTGDGPDMCIECAQQYVKQDNTCIDAAQSQREKHASTARYLTYVGLAVACAILTQKSRGVAAAVTVAVVAYVGTAEYQLAVTQTAPSIGS